jgi:prolyl-tRNA synthetase
MKISESFFKTFKEKPKEADNISAEFLIRANFIDKEASGIYSLLPLGWRVIQKISQIIREEMDAINGQELQMPTLQPKELWLETDRWDKMDPPLFKLKDRHEKEFTIGPTHEEVIVDIVRDRISSFRDLPFMLYQIQTKFRNELRSTGGLLRVREFLMKDAYSFHSDEKEFNEYYQKVIVAYKKIYSHCGLKAKLVEAHSGSIGGEKSNEFMVLAKNGESEIYLCEKCDWAATTEVIEKAEKCPKCKGEVKKAKAIEVGHIFMLGDLYSQKMGAFFTDQEGNKKPIIMGCYGIGIGRLMATIIEASHDDKGMIWPKSVTPHKVHLISLDQNEKCDKIYQDLIEADIDVLYDDRRETAGVKFADADLIGIPIRVTISPKTIANQSCEIKERDKDKLEIVKLDEMVDRIRKYD